MHATEIMENFTTSKVVNDCDDRDGTYLPSPEEIQQTCAEIQASWSESDRLRRARGQAGRTRQTVVTPRRFARLLIDFGDYDAA